MQAIKISHILFSKIESLFSIICGLIIILMMFLISMDAMGRYFLNIPFAIQYELTSYYLVPLVFMLGFSWAYREGSFVKISFLASYFSPKFQQIKLILQNLLIISCFAIILWFTAGNIYSSWLNNEVIFGIIDWPIWLAEICVPIGSIMIIIRLTFDILLSVQR